MVFVKYSADIKVIAVRLSLYGVDLGPINDRLDIEISRQLFSRCHHLHLTTHSVLADPQFYKTQGRPTFLSAEERSFIQEMLEYNPTFYLDEFADRLQIQTGITISISALDI